MFPSMSILLVYTLFQPFFVTPVRIEDRGSSSISSSSCFCGFGGVCRVDNRNHPVPENCTECFQITGSLYEPDCRTLTSHCGGGDTVTSSSSTRIHSCRNGGTCVPVLASFFCSCPPNYFGTDCSIYDPAFKFERLSEPIVYYPLRTDQHNPRLVYIGVTEFGDEFTALINFKTIGTQYQLTEIDFDWTNVKAKCLEWLSRSNNLEDPAMCNKLPGQDIRTAIIPHRTTRLMDLDKFINLTIDGEQQIVGMVDTMEIVLSNNKYTAFNHTYTLFTPISQLEILCNHRTILTGCSERREDALKHMKYEEILIEFIMRRTHRECNPIKFRTLKWFRMTHLQLYEMENSQSSRFVKFESNQLPGGINEVQVEYTLNVDPPHYGTDKFITIIGICWIDIVEGLLDVGFEGGFLQTVPCGAGFTLRAINLNENYRMEDMNFTWSCTYNADKRCQVKHSQGSVTYAASPAGCGKMYSFSMTVHHPLRAQVVRKSMNVLFQPKIGGELKILCVENCAPVSKPQLPVVLKLESKPWFPGNFEWSMVDSIGLTMYMDNVTVHQTPLGEFFYFDENFLRTELGGKNFSLTVKRGGATAGFNFSIDTPPPKPNCTSSNSKSARNRYTFDISCNAKKGEFEIFILFEIGGILPAHSINSVEWTSSGKFRGVELVLWEGTSISYFNSRGEASDARINVENLFEFQEDLVMTGRFFVELEDTLQSHEHSKTLRLLNSAVRYVLLNEEAKIPGYNGTSSVIRLLLDYFLKIDYTSQMERIVTALSFINGMVMVKEDEAVLASYNRHSMSTGFLATCRGFIALVKIKSLDNLFRSMTHKFIDAANQPIRMMLRIDSYLSNPVNSSNSKKYQTVLRLNEDASSKMIDYIVDMITINVAYSSPMVGSTLSALHFESNNSYSHWSVSGTIGFVTNEYFRHESNLTYNHVAIHRHDSINSGPYLKSSTVTLQVATLTMDFFWWHRSRTFHTEILFSRLFDSQNKTEDPPPSKEPIEITLEILPKYYHLLNGTIVSGTTILPAEDDEDRELQVRRYSFQPADGNNNLHYEFLHCGSTFGCRAVIMKHQPMTYEFPKQSYSKGDFMTRRAGKKHVKNYLGVLPDLKEKPGEIINFTLRIITGECNIWTNWKRMKNCHFSRFNGTRMIGFVNTLSWIGMTIHETKFSPVVNLKVDVFQRLKLNVYVLGITMAGIVFFFSLLCWGVFEDVRDKRKRILMDVKKTSVSQNYPYIIGVYTGATVCHTTSTVALRLIGDKIGPVGLIRAPGLPTLRSGTNDWFRMFTNESLGMIKEIHLWHDNSGCSPNWYCEKVIVFSPKEPDLIYDFQVEKFISISNESKVTVEYAQIRSSFEDSIRATGKFLMTTWKTELLNKHILLSIFYKHPRVPQTRAEHIALLWVHTFTALVGSMIFWLSYGLADESDNPTEYLYSFLCALAASFVAKSIVSYIYRRLEKEKIERLWPATVTLLQSPDADTVGGRRMFDTVKCADPRFDAPFKEL